MKIIDVVEATVPNSSSLRNARVDFSEMTTTVVAVVTNQFREGRRVVGYAFNSFGRYACGGPMRDRFIPRLLRLSPGELLDPDSGVLDPLRAVAALMRREKAGAHAERSMAVGTLELALWDIAGKMLGRPLYRLLAERFGPSPASVPDNLPCYVGGGFYNADRDLQRLQDEVDRYLEDGYTHVKIKVGGASLHDDLRRIEAVLHLVQDGDRLALDASCAFGQDQALAFASAIEPYGLRWLEEPCDPADFEAYRAVSESYGGLVAGGENLFSYEEVRNFLRYGNFGGRIVLQPDPPLAYGIGEFARIVQLSRSFGVPPEQIMPHGGNMMSLHVAAGLQLGSAESYPGLFAPFGGFSREVVVCDGRVTLPASPGIGFEEQPALFALLDQLPVGL